LKNQTEQLKNDFVRYLRDGAKPREQWRVGVEIELFGFDAATKQRLDSGQVETVLRALSEKHSGKLIVEDNLIVETTTLDGGRFTIEPGGQIEFSSAPRLSLVEIENDLETVFAHLRTVGENLNLQFLAVGFDPLRRIDEQNWFMKPRYKLMKPYLRSRGKQAWDMMTRTCSVQVNLDYSDEPDLIKKFTIGNRLAPTVTAIFANSPFVDEKANNLKSNRAAAWLETDADRCRVSPLASQDEFTLDDFVTYALEVPMLFVHKNGGYLPDFTGKTFREFLSNTEIKPTLQDFQNHLTTIFTEARLKNYIEMRSADCGDLEHTLAVAALWKGLLYDEQTLDAAFKIAPKMSAPEYYALQKAVAEDGLQAIWKNVSVLDLAKEIVRLAGEGLNRIAPAETKYLEILQRRVLLEEKSPADVLLESWDDSIEKVFELTAI
jgi:glutamate--cysteine ligase